MSDLELVDVDVEDPVLDILRVIMTQQQRIYDALLVMIAQGGLQSAAGLEVSSNLADAHAKFQFVGPEPFLTEEE